MGMLQQLDVRVLDELQIRATRYPEKVELLQKKQGESDRIAECYLLHKNDAKLSIHQQAIVFSALARSHKDTEADDLLNNILAESELADFLATYLQVKRTSEQVEPVVRKILEHLIKENQMKTLFDFVYNHILPGKPEAAKRVKIYSWGDLLDIALVKAIVASAALPSPSQNTNHELAEFLHRRLITDRESKQIRSQLTVQQAGAAFEKTGSFKYCFEFYQKVYSGKWCFHDEEVLFAKKRWLVCKDRQLKVQRRTADRKRIKSLSPASRRK
jgi:hypothetical protein